MSRKLVVCIVSSIHTLTLHFVPSFGRDSILVADESIAVCVCVCVCV